MASIAQILASAQPILPFSHSRLWALDETGQQFRQALAPQSCRWNYVWPNLKNRFASMGFNSGRSQIAKPQSMNLSGHRSSCAREEKVRGASFRGATLGINCLR
jgi:hypothetical protein